SDEERVFGGAQVAFFGPVDGLRSRVPEGVEVDVEPAHPFEDDLRAGSSHATTREQSFRRACHVDRVMAVSVPVEDEKLHAADRSHSGRTKASASSRMRGTSSIRAITAAM